MTFVEIRAYTDSKSSKIAQIVTINAANITTIEYKKNGKRAKLSMTDGQQFITDTKSIKHIRKMDT